MRTHICHRRGARSPAQLRPQGRVFAFQLAVSYSLEIAEHAVELDSVVPNEAGSYSGAMLWAARPAHAR